MADEFIPVCKYCGRGLGEHSLYQLRLCKENWERMERISKLAEQYEDKDQIEKQQLIKQLTK